MTIAQITKKLKSGQHPEDFGAKYIGEGCFRAAYRLGNRVIKLSCYYSDGPRRHHVARYLKRKGVRMAPTIYVRVSPRKRWTIQPYYRLAEDHPVIKVAGAWKYDLGGVNMGLDNKNRVVAFDW